MIPGQGVCSEGGKHGQAGESPRRDNSRFRIAADRRSRTLGIGDDSLMPRPGRPFGCGSSPFVPARRSFHTRSSQWSISPTASWSGRQYCATVDSSGPTRIVTASSSASKASSSVRSSPIMKGKAPSA